MLGDGEWLVEKSSVASEVWDGRRLPGPWLVRNAIATATVKSRNCGIAVVSVGRSHHIACLAAYVFEAPADGLLVTVQSSDPAAAGVAPFGGTAAVISPNPIAAGIPATPQPIVIDVSTSITTFGLAKRTAAAGQRLPGAWLLDGAGNPTDDPAVLFVDPPGTLLPLGGVESGHKGFGLGLLGDVLTGSLSGNGRSKRPTRWGASFLVTVIDPEAFCGFDSFIQDTSYLAAISRESRPRDQSRPVRMPGERALARRAAALRHGLILSPETAASLDRAEIRLGLAKPNQDT